MCFSVIPYTFFNEMAEIDNFHVRVRKVRNNKQHAKTK